MGFWVRAGMVKRRVIGAYGLFNLPLAVVGLPLVIFIPPLYAVDLGVSLAAVGQVMMLARIADVVIDPLIGVACDRFPTPFGRRRPWIFIGALLTMLGVIKVFIPPGGAGALYLLGWISVLYLGWSLATIPYLAWGSNLSSDYHERSVIAGTRELFTFVGVMMAFVAPAILPHAPGSAATVATLAHLILWVLPLATLVLFVVVPEPRVAAHSGHGFTEALKLLWRNLPFRRLMSASLLGGIGSAINASLLVLFYREMDLGGHTIALLGIYLFSAIAGVPFWVWLARRIGKHRALVAGSLWGCLWFAMVPFVPPGQFALLATINLMTGLSIGAAPALGASMAADVIDLDALRARRDRSALFFSLWSMAAKFTGAIGIGIAYPVLGFLGWRADGHGGPHAHFALVAMYCLVPIGFWLAAVALLWNYPIDRVRQARIAGLVKRRFGR